ncbi:MAG: hypothetical protein OXJ52_05660 [Oligoflexia bacterium]|nr:hypothetical protein [Oligoflexia bacterium]
MKYLLIIGAFFLSGAFAETRASSSNAENCAYATQDTHTVSESSYNKLLAQLNQDDTDTETRAPRKGAKGQK